MSGRPGLTRVLEPEVMDTPEEARDYDAMDHAEVNERFCADLLAFAPGLHARVLDVGTGTALIPVELCKRAEGIDVVGIDLAVHMLALAERNIARAGLSGRITVAKVDAKALPYEAGAFGATVSNSIVHHIPEPPVVLAEMWRVTASGGVLFVRDLARPDTTQGIADLVDLYGGEPPSTRSLDSYANQIELFRASLAAALTVSEVVAMIAPLGLDPSNVRMTSDRHWTLAARKP